MWPNRDWIRTTNRGENAETRSKMKKTRSRNLVYIFWCLVWLTIIEEVITIIKTDLSFSYN